MMERKHFGEARPGGSGTFPNGAIRILHADKCKRSA